MVKYSFLLNLFFCFYYSYGQDLVAFEIPFKSYTYSPDECTRLQHTSGTQIFIPKNAFNIDSVSVTLKYREMRNPLDMLIHQINMTTNFIGQEFYLISQGMFEIYALAGKDTLKLNENNAIQVRFSQQMNKLASRTEGYKYDFEKQNWELKTQQINLTGVSDRDSVLWGSSPVSEQMTEDESELWGSFDGDQDCWCNFDQGVDSLRNEAFQSMDIDEFGLYNYDFILQDAGKRIPIAASFKKENGKSINTKIYVVYEDFNTIYNFPPYDWENNFFLYKKAFSLFTIDEDGTIYRLISNPDLNSINNGKKQFILEFQGKPKSRKALAELTGLN